MSKYKLMLAGAALLAIPAIGLADAVNIDIQGATDGGPGYNMNVGTYSGTGVAPDAGTTWNAFQFNNTYASGLLDSQGNATEVNLWLQGTPGEWSYSGTPANALMNDYTFTGAAWSTGVGERFTLFSNGADGVGFEINGTQAFDIYIYTQGDAAGQHATFQLNHAGGTTVQTATGSAPFDGTYTEGGNVLKFSNVTAYETATAGQYEFEFWWGHDGSGTAAINGIQLVAVPEPATLGLVSAAGLGVLFIRRRMMM